MFTILRWIHLYNNWQQEMKKTQFQLKYFILAWTFKIQFNGDKLTQTGLSGYSAPPGGSSVKRMWIEAKKKTTVIFIATARIQDAN